MPKELPVTFSVTDGPKVLAANASFVANRYVVEASILGLRPGQWPDFLRFLGACEGADLVVAREPKFDANACLVRYTAGANACLVRYTAGSVIVHVLND